MADFLVIARVVSCGVGAVLALFLASLASRSQEQGRQARVLYAICALVFYLCGVMNGAFGLIASNATLIDTTGLLRLTAAALLPISAIGMWLEDDGIPIRRRRFGGWLFRISIVNAAAIVLVGVVTVWVVPQLPTDAMLRNVLLMHRVHAAASYNAFSVMAIGVWLLVRSHGRGRFQQLAVWTMLAGLFIGIVSIVLCDFFALQPSVRSLVLLAKEQGVALVLIGSMLYFARFRAVDVFLKLTLRLLAGVALGLVATGLALRPIRSMADASTAPFAFTVIGYTVLIGLVALLVQRVFKATDAVVERYIFGKPDYRRAAEELQERLALLESDATVIAATEEFVGRTLGMLDVRVLSADAMVQDAAQVPIFVGNQSQYLLTVSPRSREHIVMTIDVEFLRDVAVIVGRRLEALARERERVERARREAQLEHQVVSAELRALRSQLNPHFLFNALNTIAALVPHAPEQAESMVVQLAKVFRHLLTHSEKSFSSLQEELEFLRTYLDIEKVRFGERLMVEFDIAVDATTATVPSLILQPLVENALKHGLATKRGDNQLIIRAGRVAGALSLSVEDNGVGISKPTSNLPGSGVGLRNIRERLRTIYGPRASLVLENIAQGGSRALLIIPMADTA